MLLAASRVKRNLSAKLTGLEGENLSRGCHYITALDAISGSSSLKLTSFRGPTKKHIAWAGYQAAQDFSQN